MAEMGSDQRLSRRAFIKVSALAGGGLLLGVGLAARAEDEAHDMPQSSGGADPAIRLEPSAWIRIHGDGRIVVLLARSEMGQGVMTTLPMLVAEELEVGLDQIEVAMAPVAEQYRNALLGTQATARSTSMRDAWVTLREAGAAARTLMIRAAATEWGAAESECEARRGVVHHADGTRSFAYAELAAKAAELTVPAAVALKPKDAWTLIGTSAQRLDLPEKVTGQARYGLDVRLPGMLYATLFRCPTLGSRIRGWQDRAARDVPGVVDVLGVQNGVAVVAESSWAALQGRAKLEVTWRPTGNPRASTARIRSRLSIGLKGRSAVARKDGDVGSALAAAHQEMEAVFESSFLPHACMEPLSCTADVRADHCALHVATQAQEASRETATRLTGLAPQQVSVTTTLLGGGLGRRLEQDVVADAVELSLRMKRPVQVLWTREDDLKHDFYAPMTLHRLRGGIDAGGSVVAWFHRVVGPSVLSRVNPAQIRDGIDDLMVEGAVDFPYSVPDVRVEYRRADTPVPIGIWQGGGYIHNAFAVECFLDELAMLGGQDPMSVRQRLVRHDQRAVAVLGRLAEVSAWQEPAEPGRARGLALVKAFGSLIGAVAEVSADAGETRVHRLTCVVDCGQAVNPGVVRSQIERGIALGLTAALKGGVTFSDGRVEQRGFSDYSLLTSREMPAVSVDIRSSSSEPGGVSGLGMVVAAPAVANAVSRVSGQRIRTLPIRLA